MASVWPGLLLFLAVLLRLATTSNAHGDDNLTLPCHPDQAATLLELKKSFLFDEATTNLSSWQEGTNCCLWEGVDCGGSSGRVTALDLNGRSFSSSGLDPVIFNLSSLQFLDLSMNDFGQYSMPAIGFERLTFLAHLNLSNSNFHGEIPIAIGKLENLISLDLSSHYGTFSDDRTIENNYLPNSLSVSNIQAIVVNLSNLRALYLDFVKIHSTGKEWCEALAKYVPRLQVLSFEQCGLSGPIHQSLSNLSSLIVINLQHNNGISAGPFPEFFTYFVNLSVLQVAGINLNGWFPSMIFQSEKLSVLDLSWNMDLSGTFPNLSDASSLEILRLDETNFSYSKPTSTSNFKSLKELALDGKFISADFLSSFNLLGSLSHFSWISDLRNLRSLELFKCDLSNTNPFYISKLKSLRSLNIDTCNISSPILAAITNLKDLQNLYITRCRLNGSIPSTIGNLTNLRRLHINECGFLGAMPSSVGNLVNLRNLDIHGSDFSGPLPSTIGFLRNLKSLQVEDCKFVGSIPYAVGQLKELTRLVLRGSNFSGVIPSSVGNLTCLLELDLSMNFLSGKIMGQFLVLFIVMCCII
nr:receptor-like protein 35 [Lolium perenne]